jgi:hypothetical protein
MNLKGVASDDVDWNELARYMMAFVNTVMNCRVAQTSRASPHSEGLVSYIRKKSLLKMIAF